MLFQSYFWAQPNSTIFQLKFQKYIIISEKFYWIKNGQIDAEKKIQLKLKLWHIKPKIIAGFLQFLK